ncbi:hypothetical protein KC218_21615, partial [Mycobacterium tuberculosis]|nr:hypothetical protein [Mycobacterium tuberculosis]
PAGIVGDLAQEEGIEDVRAGAVVEDGSQRRLPLSGEGRQVVGVGEGVAGGTAVPGVQPRLVAVGRIGADDVEGGKSSACSLNYNFDIDENESQNVT